MFLKQCASLRDITPQIFRRSLVDFQYNPRCCNVGFLDHKKKSLMYTFLTPFPIDIYSTLWLQLVQRINSIYCTKRGKKRLKKLSMSTVETTSLRGKGASFIHWTDKWVNICLSVTLTEFWLCSSHDIWPHMFVKLTSDPLKNPLAHLMSASRWQQREWERLWWQVQTWVTAAFVAKGQGSEFLRSCFSSLCVQNADPGAETEHSLTS